VKYFALVLTTFLLASCATNVERDPIDYKSRDYKSQQSERIIYRDLTVPKSGAQSSAAPSSREAELAAITRDMRAGDRAPTQTQVSEAQPALADAKPAAIVSVPHVTDPFYIPFYNESSVLPSERLPVLRDIVKHHKDGNHYVVMGHSHGQSFVGTAKLAQQRAEAVTNWMIGQGIDKTVIHQTASWGSHRDSLAPPKGVLVYVTGEHNGRYLLSLTPFDFDKEAEYEQPQLASTGT